jgi:hypothetical protein
MHIAPTIPAGALLLLAASLFARQHSDVIVLQNGDRITGEIKGLASGIVRIDLDYVDGALAVNWAKVVRVESPQLFIIQTQDGTVYTGSLLTIGDSSTSRMLTIKVDDAGQTQVGIDRSMVVRMDETSENIFRPLSGAVDLGVVYTKGNNATQYNLGAELEYRRERWGLESSLSSNLSANSGSKTATYNEVNLAAYRLLPWKNYYYSAFGGFLQSSAQGIDLRRRGGIGAGRYFKNTNRVRMSMLLGPVWQHVNYRTVIVPVASQQIYGAAILTNLNIFLFKKTNLTLRSTVAPALSESGRLFADTDLSYYWKIFGDLSWNVSFYGNWDTRPPPTFAGTDYGYSSGIKWTFGYR